jgi:hypothetical protein
MTKKILTQEIIKERFFNKVLKLPSGCWLWMGAIQGKYYKRENGGYGSFRYFGAVTPAHIVSCRIHGIEIPEGHEIDHLCRITSCVNPEHIEPVTRAVNFERGIGNKGEAQSAKTHCINGHPYSDENTAIRKGKRGNPERQCRICRRNTENKHYAKRKLLS